MMAEFPKTRGTRSWLNWCFAFFWSIENGLLAKSRGFQQKRGTCLPQTGNQQFLTFCNSKDLFFIKASYLESQQKPTASKDKKGPQERSCLSLSTDIPQQTKHRPSPALLWQQRASGHKTRSPRITESPPQFSLFPPKAAWPHCSGIDPGCVQGMGGKWLDPGWVVSTLCSCCTSPSIQDFRVCLENQHKGWRGWEYIFFLCKGEENAFQTEQESCLSKHRERRLRKPSTCRILHIWKHSHKMKESITLQPGFFPLHGDQGHCWCAAGAKRDGFVEYELRMPLPAPLAAGCRIDVITGRLQNCKEHSFKHEGQMVLIKRK